MWRRLCKPHAAARTPTIAFVVDDIREAIAEVQTAGVELVGEPVWAAEAFGDPTLEGFAWFFVRAPDGRVYVIQQVPD